MGLSQLEGKVFTGAGLTGAGTGAGSLYPKEDPTLTSKTPGTFTASSQGTQMVLMSSGLGGLN